MNKQTEKWNIIFLLIVGLTIVTTQAQTSQLGLTVKEKSGQKSTYALNALSKLTFSTGSMAINKKDGSSVSVLTANVSYLSFSSITALNNIYGDSNTNPEKMFLSPNPVKDHFQIRYESFSAESTQLEVINMQGKVVLRQSFNSQAGINYINVPFESCQNGIYFCRLQNGNQLEVAKFIKY